MANEQILLQAATNFFSAYRNVLTDPDDISDSLELFLDLFVEDPRDPYSASQEALITYSGKPGATPFFGQFRGEQGVRTALTGLTRTTDANSLTVQEVIPTSFRVDFSLLPASPLIPQSNRVAVLLDEVHTVKETGLSYRLDTLALLTVEDNGDISSVDFYYDSYVPLQAFAGVVPQIVDPDIDVVLDSRRDRTTTAEETIQAAFGFFGTFAGIDEAARLISPNDNVSKPDFTPLLATVTDDVVLKFAGDPLYLPFADNEIRTGKAAVERTFLEQFTDSRPRTFDMQEWFVAGDRLIANTFEQRTAVSTRQGYDVQVEIMLTAKDGLIGSVEGVFDSAITSTAFTGIDLLPTDYMPNEDKPVVRQQADSEFLNLTAYQAGPVEVSLEVFSDASFNNTIGVFRVDDITGLVDGLRPGDAGYMEAAFSNTVLSFDRGQSSSGNSSVTSQVLPATVDGAVILAAYVITNGTVESFLAANPGNERQAGSPNAFFTFESLNPDQFDHFRLAGNTIQVEDLWGGGDADFDDINFAVNVTSGVFA
jgi:ketosteroid isomerase-like protein